ncbi:MAG: nucleotidyl transferase AbiEii/AbiGii toxin family protein [Acidimicrobiales bacterium]
MIDRTEIEAVAGRFGAPDTQIIRDHLISHVLAAIADWPDRDRVTFFGGTALCRTWLPDLRLSEDIDLLLGSPTDGDGLRAHITRRLRREFPNLTWTGLGSQHQVETWALAADDLEVKVQFARRPEWQTIPVAIEPVQLRYSDLSPSVHLRVPTPSGFAAMKLMAWFDRHTPRDLYDLAALADAGHIDETAVTLVRPIAGFTPGAANLERSVPRSVASSWQTELGHQASDLDSPDDCLARVRAALDRISE